MNTPNEKPEKQVAQKLNPTTIPNAGQCIGKTSTDTRAMVNAVTEKTPTPIQEQPVEEKILTEAMIEELLASIKKDAEWGAFINFLDTVSHPEVMAQIKIYVQENNVACGVDDDLFDWYISYLEKWPYPEKSLFDAFRRHFPLVSAKLNTPQKVRIFLRGAEFCNVFPDTLASLAEHILRQHESEGKDYVTISRSPYYEQRLPERLTYFTQLQMETLRKLLFPDVKETGCGDVAYFDWREKKQKKD